MVTDDYSPMYAGDTQNPFSVQFSNHDGTPVSITGATFTLVMVNSAPYSRQIGTGTWVIDEKSSSDLATRGQAHYLWSSADVAIPGTWTIQVESMTGGQPLHFDPKILQIEPLL